MTRASAASAAQPVLDRADVPIAWPLLGITVFGAALRIFHLGFKSLWFDEAVLFWNANGDLAHVLNANAHANSAPPLFALLLRLAMTLGTSEVALRAIACAAGIAAIPAMYWLARHFLSNRGALMASLLVAVAPQMVRYSQQVREYSLAFLLAIFLAGVFTRFARKPSGSLAAMMGALMAVSIFTQYGLALLILSLNLIVVVRLLRGQWSTRALWLWVGANLVAVAAVAAVYELSLKHQFVSGGFGSTAGSDYLASGYWDRTARSSWQLLVRNTGAIVEFALPGAVSIFACVLGVVAAVRSDRSQRLMAELLLVPFVVTFGAALARAFPYIGERQTIFLAPMIYVSVAAGLGLLWRLTRDVGVAGVATMFILGASGNYTAGYLLSTVPEHMRPIADTLRGTVAPNEQIYVYYGADPAFRYYFRTDTTRWTAGTYAPGNPGAHRAQLDTLLREPAPWWLVFSHVDPAEMEIILAHVTARRKVALVRHEDNAWLYRAD